MQANAYQSTSDSSYISLNDNAFQNTSDFNTPKKFNGEN